MRLVLLVFVLTIAGCTLAKEKAAYWWLFPKFDEHSPDNQKESSYIAAVAAEMGGDERNESIGGLNSDTDGLEVDLEYEDDIMDEQSGDADKKEKLNEEPQVIKDAKKPNSNEMDDATLDEEMRSRIEKEKEKDDLALIGEEDVKGSEPENKSESEDADTPLEIVEEELIIDDNGEKGAGDEDASNLEEKVDTLEESNLNNESDKKEGDVSKLSETAVDAEREKKKSSEEDSSEEKAIVPSKPEVEEGSGSSESDSSEEEKETAPKETEQDEDTDNENGEENLQVDDEEERVALELASVRQMLKNVEQDQDSLTIDAEESKSDIEQVDDDDDEDEKDYDVLNNGVDSGKDKDTKVDEANEPDTESDEEEDTNIDEAKPKTLEMEMPVCGFNSTPFTLEVEPKSVNEDVGSDTLLLCKVTPINATIIPVPAFRLSWIFQKNYCPKDASQEECVTVIRSATFETQETIYILSYELINLNQTEAGKYTCQAEIFGCEATTGSSVNVTQTSASLFLRIYVKPNYGIHIAVISMACVVLLIILIGLFYYARKIGRKHKSRYQELLSSTEIQYQPTKVLELPNSVYNPTTTPHFTRMSAVSSFSSKSSFSSGEEEA